MRTIIKIYLLFFLSLLLHAHKDPPNHDQVTINIDEYTIDLPKTLLVKHDSMMRSWIEDDFDKQLDSKGNIVLSIKNIDAQLFSSYVVPWLQKDAVEFTTISDAIRTFQLADYLSLDAFKTYITVWINFNAKKNKTALRWVRQNPIDVLKECPDSLRSQVGYKISFKKRRQLYTVLNDDKIEIGKIFNSNIPDRKIYTYKTNILTEYNKRNHHKQLIFAPDSLNRATVFNIETQAFIGYSHAGTFGDFSYGNGSSSYELGNHLKKCKIIELAVGDLICTYNEVGNFAIYDINTGNNVIPTKSFNNKNKCVKTLKVMAKTY